MQKNYFLLSDFNNLQEHVKQLIANLAIDQEEEIAAGNELENTENDAKHDTSKDSFEERARLIRKYQEMLTNNVMICKAPIHAERVNLGVYVKLKEVNSKKAAAWHWIGSSWMKPSLEKRTGKTKELAHQLTVTSPVAKALQGKKKNQVVEIQLPGKKVTYKIGTISLK